MPAALPDGRARKSAKAILVLRVAAPDGGRARCEKPLLMPPATSQACMTGGAFPVYTRPRANIVILGIAVVGPREQAGRLVDDRGRPGPFLDVALEALVRTRRRRRCSPARR